MMKVRATWEFEVDTDDIDPKFVDVTGLAKDLTQQELAFMIEHGLLSADDFEYSVVVE